jgi:hypothetical protein
MHFKSKTTALSFHYEYALNKSFSVFLILSLAVHKKEKEASELNAGSSH